MDKLPLRPVDDTLAPMGKGPTFTELAGTGDSASTGLDGRKLASEITIEKWDDVTTSYG